MKNHKPHKVNTHNPHYATHDPVEEPDQSPTFFDQLNRFWVRLYVCVVAAITLALSTAIPAFAQTPGQGQGQGQGQGGGGGGGGGGGAGSGGLFCDENAQGGAEIIAFVGNATIWIAVFIGGLALLGFLISVAMAAGSVVSVRAKEMGTTGMFWSGGALVMAILAPALFALFRSWAGC